VRGERNLSHPGDNDDGVARVGHPLDWGADETLFVISSGIDRCGTALCSERRNAQNARASDLFFSPVKHACEAHQHAGCTCGALARAVSNTVAVLAKICRRQRYMQVIRHRQSITCSSWCGGRHSISPVLSGLCGIARSNSTTSDPCTCFDGCTRPPSGCLN
jgi:hypothetical protein